MKKLMVIFVFFLLVLPANADVGEISDIEKLQAKINLLIVEVEKLQNTLNGLGISGVDTEALSRERISEIIDGGVVWFKQAQEENGHFKYEYLPYENGYLDDDNIVRQAGALYALGEIVSHDNEDKYALVGTLEKSISFFENLSSVGEVDERSFRCISNSEFNSFCQLGATSLALVGLIDLVEAHPELREKYDSLINDYGTYILLMSKENGGFRAIYNHGSPLNDKESSFSNGEAVLALARYYKYSPNEEVRKVIDKSFEYFKTKEFDFPLYLWIMAALKDMKELWNKEDYVTYAREYTDWRVNGVRYRKNSPHNYCAYIEGVISAYTVFEDSLVKDEKDRYLREINFWLNKSLDLQIDEKDMYRILSDEKGVRFGEIVNKKQSFGGFLTGETKLTQRIDFTQHCLNSYLQKLIDIDRASSL
jgi:hypothetical protein